MLPHIADVGGENNGVAIVARIGADVAHLIIKLLCRAKGEAGPFLIAIIRIILRVWQNDHREFTASTGPIALLQCRGGSGRPANCNRNRRHAHQRH